MSDYLNKKPIINLFVVIIIFSLDRISKFYVILQSEKNISFLVVNTVSEGELYFFIKEAITLSFSDKYFFAVFQYVGVLFMSWS